MFGFPTTSLHIIKLVYFAFKSRETLIRWLDSFLDYWNENNISSKGILNSLSTSVKKLSLYKIHHIQPRGPEYRSTSWSAATLITKPSSRHFCYYSFCSRLSTRFCSFFIARKRIVFSQPSNILQKSPLSCRSSARVFRL